jgi:hypothetical protein
LQPNGGGSPASSAAATSQNPSTAAAPAERPSWTPEKFWDGGKHELKGTELRGELDRLTAIEAADISRKASVPAPDAYQLKFNPDFVVPEGMQWSWDGVDPALITQARSFANANGMSQEQFSGMLGLHAARLIAENQLVTTAKAAEVGKLGPNGNTRIDAVKTWVHAIVGDDAPALLRVIEQAPMASTIAAFEKMIRIFTTQGVGGSPGAHRDGAGSQPEKLSDADYAKLTYAEKQAYAAKFDQSRFNGRGP